MPVIWLEYTNRESGGRIPVMVEWEWNVLKLKEAISSQLCRTPEKLIFSGRVMYNKCKLGDLSISEFSTVYCELAAPYTPQRKVPRSLPSPRRDMGVDLSDIQVKVDGECYVRMRKQEPYYIQMRSADAPRDEVFDFSLRRYLLDTNSTISEHYYETLEPFTLHSSHSQRSGIKTTRRHFFVFCRDVCSDITQGKLRVRCYSCKSSQFVLSRDPSCWDDVIGYNIAGVCGSCRCERGIAEFYFKCANHSQQESIATPLKQVKMNDKLVECIICGDCPDRLMVFECTSLHVTCLACFKEYVRVNLTSRQFRYDSSIGYSLGCPAGCPNSLITDAQHFRLVGEELYERLQRFAAEEFVLAEGGVLCPAVGCGEGVLLGSEERLVTCETCCHMFCRHCLNPGHFGACERSLPVRGGVARVNMRGSSIRSSWRFGGVGREGIEEGQDWRESVDIKSCPGCNVAVEREGGCAHMTCGIGVCSQEWCWLCEKKWNLECREDHWFD